MYTNQTVCRACGLGQIGIPTLKQSTAAGQTYAEDGQLKPVFDLGIQPLANDFVKPGGAHKGFAPLKVMLCPRCSMAQLSVVVDPGLLYRDYLYITSPAQLMQDHFAALLQTMDEEQSVRRVIEIGSNDGKLLSYLMDHGAVKVLGIDPAQNLAEIARKAGVSTLGAAWNNDTARTAAMMMETGVDIILARHVFCHVPDWQDFLHNLLEPSKRDTLVCIEVPYVLDMLARKEFDTVYHEHTSYLSIRAFVFALKGTGWNLHRVVHFPIHGGAILLMLRRRDYEGQPHASVKEFTEKENITEETWKAFAFESHKNIEALSALVRHYRANGKKVVGYGASAKSTVWINACGFTRKDIAFITDNTPQKLYRNSPANDIPIVDEGALTRELPDYAICFAWNFFEEIFQKEKIFRDKGGKWIIPHCEIKVI